jgi:hypothetical protein
MTRRGAATCQLKFLGSFAASIVLLLLLVLRADTIDLVGGGASSDGGTTPSDSGSCQDVPDDGMNIPYQAGTGTPPAAAGGTIASGTYTLTSEVTYSASEAGLPLSSLGTIRSTLIVLGSTVSTYFFASVAGSGMTATSTFTTSGTNLTLVETCPDTASTTVGYTATATTVAFIDLDTSGDTTISTYTMQ